MDMLRDFLDGKIPTLNTVRYTYKVPSDSDEGNNLSKLLVISGEYDRSVGIPFSSFTSNPWIVHDKFTNYLLGMSITPYSESENITYLQELLKLEYPEYQDDFRIGCFNDTMKELLLKYQKSKYTVTKGDLNLDGKIDNTDLYMLEKYIAGDIEFSNKQKTLADINGDSLIDENDVEIMKKQISGEIDDLTVFEIPFSLGYLDVQTEAIILRELQGIGVIRS